MVNINIRSMQSECHFFHTQGGKCKRGDGCNFKHTDPPLGYCPRKGCKLCGGKKVRKEDFPDMEKKAEIEPALDKARTEPADKKVPEPMEVEETKKEPVKLEPGSLPRWEEKEPGSKLKATVRLSEKTGEPLPEKKEVVEEKRVERPPREERRDKRGGGRGGHRREPRPERGDREIRMDERRAEFDGDKKEEIYAPQGNPVIDDKLIEIKKKEDAAYEEIAAGKTKVLATRLREVYQDLQIFKPLERVFQEKLSLDLMFIMDCTGSMSSWIKACKQELFNIIDFVMGEHEGAKINISVVAYRDHCDKDRSIQVLPFTNQKDVALSFIGKLTAYGGGDCPEDICGGFEEALQQDWKSSAKYAILITDAPCHGKKYHDTGDDYPKGDPKGRDPEKQLIQLAEKGINMYGIKMNDMTTKMFRIFSDVYQSVAKRPLTVADLGQGTGSFGFFVANTVTATLASSVVNSDVSFIKRALKELKEIKKDNKLTVEQQLEHLMKMSEFPSEAPAEKKEMEVEEEKIFYADKFTQAPNWRNLQDSQRHKCIEHTYFIVKDKGVPINWRKPLLQNSQIHSEIVLANKPFAEGGMRYAFYAFDTLLDQKLVAKINKKHKYNTLDQMSKDLELVYICQHLVNTYNASVVEYIPDSRLLLTFVHTFLIEIPDLKKIYYAENFIEGVYEKFNNNAGWANNRASESSFISQAFSHYSWQATEGYLMVVDLQGASGILTDPQIHCLDGDRFGAGNLGYEGILKFFFNHRCNTYCKKLGLIHPKHTGELPEVFGFYGQEIPKPADLRQKVYTICDLCKGAFTSTAGFVYSKRLEDQLKYCKPCDDKRKASMKKGTCEWCKTGFNSSEYWFKMMRTDFPTLCGDCRKKRREMWRKELEDKPDPEIKP